MPKQKPVTCYGTLDVLLMYLLGYQQKKVRIRKDSFDYHSYWFSKQVLRCVSVQITKDKQSKQWVVLKCLNKKAIRNHLTKFFILYEQNKIKTPYRKLIPTEWDLFLQKTLNRQLLIRKKLKFSFTPHQPVLPYGSDACAFNFMATGIYAALNQMEESARALLNTFSEVVFVSMPENSNDAYITFKMPKEMARVLLLMWFGYPFMHWRTRIFSRKATYKKHTVDFHSSGEKEKQLLDLLLKYNGRVSVNVASKVLDMEEDGEGEKRTLESIKHSLSSMGHKIHAKAVKACIGSKDTVDFVISVIDNWVTMEDDSPINS